MLVMPSNNGRYLVHYWAGLYGNLGHLYSPGGQRGPFEHLPYALDNGAYSAYLRQAAWDAQVFRQLLKWAADSEIQPMWVACPDVVADTQRTLAQWDSWAQEIRAHGFKAALVVQDGMTDQDIAATEADALFIGGSTDWKWSNLYRLCELHPTVHVGRVNGYRGLVKCRDAGASSVDGTGWFRGDQTQLAGLKQFLFEQAQGLEPGSAQTLWGPSVV